MNKRGKKGWTRIAFGDVVRQVTDRVDPKTSGLERYVAGEHMDTDDLRIRRWGIIGDGYLGPAFHMHFKPGHVLYGSRRTYLRKVAVADFEGITANTTFVLETKDSQVLLPELLPFLMQTESFHEHSIKQSKGSVNPYINFSDLTWYEFDLPTMEEQRRIVSVLLATLSYENSSKTLCASIAQILKVVTESLCWNREWQIQPVVNIADPTIGRFLDGDWIETKDQSDEGIRLLQLADIGEGVFLNKSKRYVSNDTFLRLGCTEVLTNDLLVARMAEPIGRTCIVSSLDTRCITAVDCCIVRINKAKHDLRYWLFVLNSPSWTRLVESAAAGSTRSRISRRNLEAIMVPVPDRDNQNAIAERLMTIKDALTEAEARADTVRKMSRDILSRNLGGDVT